MSQVPINDASDELIITKMGTAVRAAMAAKEALHNSIAEAIDSSTTFGYELGAEDAKFKLIAAFEAENSPHVEWALGVIKTTLN